jgi:3-hydroxybutyryl-CoA dehydrogenase
MDILVIGSDQNLLECRQKFGETHYYQTQTTHSDVERFFHDRLIVFDFLIARQPRQIKVYKNFSGVAFLDASKISLEKILSKYGVMHSIFGFCGIPTFLNRGILEVSLPMKENRQRLEETCLQLNASFAVVKDQVGLVTPRVICMIINEAYFLVQEKIAVRADIDLAMKLGTNYPLGPFEWASRIGIRNVYELLNAVYRNTKDERYIICELLENEANHFMSHS